MNNLEHTALTQTFCEFVQIDSPTGQEQAFSDHLFGQLKSLSCDPSQDERGNILVQLDGEGEPLLLAAHIDTVEPGRGIVPVIKDGVVSSEGATILGADNKAAVAILFELIKSIKQQNIATRPLDILFSVSEEAGVSGVTTFDHASVRATHGLCFDASQPLHTVVISSPFYASFTISLEGVDADASNPEGGVSVETVLAQLLTELPSGQYHERARVNVGTVSAGTAVNALMSQAVLVGEIRSFSKELLDEIQGVVSNVAQLAASEGVTVTVEHRLENHGYEFDVDDPLMVSVDAHIKNTYDVAPHYMPYWGISDANEFHKKGIRVLNLGNRVREPHTTRERIAVADMELLYEFIYSYIAV